MGVQKDKPFDLEVQWKHFLKILEINESKMPALQVKMMKQAFYGGAGIIIELFSREVENLSDDEIEDGLVSMIEQELNFWKQQLANDLLNEN